MCRQPREGRRAVPPAEAHPAHLPRGLRRARHEQHSSDVGDALPRHGVEAPREAHRGEHGQLVQAPRVAGREQGVEGQREGLDAHPFTLATAPRQRGRGEEGEGHAQRRVGVAAREHPMQRLPLLDEMERRRAVQVVGVDTRAVGARAGERRGGQGVAEAPWGRGREPAEPEEHRVVGVAAVELRPHEPEGQRGGQGARVARVVAQDGDKHQRREHVAEALGAQGEQLAQQHGARRERQRRRAAEGSRAAFGPRGLRGGEHEGDEQQALRRGEGEHAARAVEAVEQHLGEVLVVQRDGARGVREGVVAGEGAAAHNLLARSDEPRHVAVAEHEHRRRAHRREERAGPQGALGTGQGVAGHRGAVRGLRPTRGPSGRRARGAGRPRPGRGARGRWPATAARP